MATWLARKARAEHGRPVCFIDRADRPRWHPLWQGNPNITRIDRGAHLVRECPGHRHYIVDKTPTAWRWRRVPDREPGDLFLPSEAAPRGGPFVYIEPNTKPGASPNKVWPFGNYQAVIDALPAVRFIQCGPGRVLKRCEHINTATVLQALQVLAHASLYVGPEGGMHHAAAALRVPAVVIFGGYIAPDVTGYRGHVNLYAGGEPCGMRTPCRHCADAMASITVDRVSEAINAQLEGCKNG